MFKLIFFNALAQTIPYTENKQYNISQNAWFWKSSLAWIEDLPSSPRV